ncbi:hypothetical protein GCM10027346_42720 [Hymenobacter seoulensis]
MQTFLLQQRPGGHWSSTYESARILETINPELLADGSGAAAATVRLTGALTREITQFPYEVTLPPGEHASLTVHKQGALPVYATAYQSFHNPTPSAAAAPFQVRTSLNGLSTSRVSIRAGQPVELVVTVIVPAEARYVLLEVPIPAGCSYGLLVPVNRYEVHREYMRYQTGIFCDVLPAGKHVFRIALQPRFRGQYTVNPALASLLYFPTRFGRTESKQALIN